MDIVTLGAALNGSAEYVNSHFKGGSNIQIVDNPDGTQTINASGEVSAEDTVARADIAAIKDGETLDSFGDVETALGDKADTSTTYTKTEVDTALSAKANSADVYSKTAVDTALSNKADKSTTYTKTEVDTSLSNKADKSTTYTKTEVDTALDDKVDKETGKGLSTNDYTTTEKTKLAGIAEGAEVNVQSNWTQTTTTADDYIKNKPTLGTAAAKNATDTYNATGNDVTTGKAVAAALATLPEPMVFKGSLGTGGTITTLPTASSSNKGYVYKVITAGTYASQSAKVGDTFISDGSSWVLIPSGDEPSGTVTNVAVANGGGLTVSGSPITSSGTITVGHSNSVTAKTSSSLKKFTYDANGHVTGSSELSTAESDALASGIDSAKVAQIEMNKNNILSLYNQGVKNLAKPNVVSAISGITIVQNMGHYEISGTTGGSQYTTYLCTPTEDIIATEDLYIPAAATRTNVSYLCHWKNSQDVSQFSIIGTGLTIPQGCKIHTIYIQVAANTTFSFNADMMICKKAIYDADPTYQPYAMSNAELTVDSDEDRSALVELVDGGAKNIADLTSTTKTTYTTATSNGVTITRNGDIFTISGTSDTNDNIFFNIYYAGSASTKIIPPGNWVAIIEDYTGTVVNDIAVQIVAPTTSAKVYGVPIQFSLSGSESGNRLRVNLRPSTTYDGSFRLMICSKAAWDISQTYQPYRPSYQELYERVVALEQANQ